ncbi:YfbU family protein [Clostridium botulinum]|uniref:YfbU family protein n=1 Tax=Clostridium botulinum TaxID=1491 RepID=UPI001C9A3748|nr:YfbU family protein [Clostridium botulinum]MBY6811669.1 YfbU family protein [Clostridium botulinum]MBY6825342.1 YfbU family protein [Clostridium botulinum]MBY6835464.1 YfbU family protein [Clostridium botulinum]MBY6973877.1 YfbU family protein [Clostridium botulinum]MCS6105324.1 hypothetical protein [Clostridium botulinum]
MKLSKVERLILANQFKILEALYPDDEKYYSNSRIALEEGFESHYDNCFEVLSENELTSEECDEVIEILNMYRAITFSYQKLKDKEDIDEDEVKFEGFDLNDENEGKRVIYTRYFINDLDRFEELKYGDKYADFNSHSIMLPTYRNRLGKWKQLEKSFNLSKDEIIEITSLY